MIGRSHGEPDPAAAHRGESRQRAELPGPGIKILDPEKTQSCFNSEWSDKPAPEGMIRLAARYNGRPLA